MKRICGAILVAIGLSVCGAMAGAQEAPGIGSMRRTDVALSGYEAFTPTATDSAGNTQSPSNAPGGLVEVRHLMNPLIGFEGTYSFNRANQSYSENTVCAVGVTPCPATATYVKANQHELTADWVPSFRFGGVRPFGVLGIGILLNVPTSGQTGTQSATKPVYVYGVGVDWAVLPHLGLRFQGRGNLYNAPQLSTVFSSANKFMQTAEPMVGIYFKL